MLEGEVREGAVDLDGLLCVEVGRSRAGGAVVLVVKKDVMRVWRGSLICFCLRGRVGAERRSGRRILRKDMRWSWSWALDGRLRGDVGWGGMEVGRR